MQGIHGMGSQEQESPWGRFNVTDGLRGHTEFKPTSVTLLSKHLSSPRTRKSSFWVPWISWHYRKSSVCSKSSRNIVTIIVNMHQDLLCANSVARLLSFDLPSQLITCKRESEQGTIIIIPILQMRKLWFRDFSHLPRPHKVLRSEARIK